MADDQNGMEKTEQATPKRLSDAREEGQVFKADVPISAEVKRLLEAVGKPDAAESFQFEG